MNEYTPDTEDVAFCFEGPDLDAGERRAAFDRWLAGVVREAKAEALREAHVALGDAGMKSEGLFVALLDRADQIERTDDA